jgi:hypothetical protein
MQEFNTEFFCNKDFVIKKEKLNRDVQLQFNQNLARISSITQHVCRYLCYFKNTFYMTYLSFVMAVICLVCGVNLFRGTKATRSLKLVT